MKFDVYIDNTSYNKKKDIIIKIELEKLTRNKTKCIVHSLKNIL